MEKELLELGSFTEKVVAQYAVDSTMLLVVGRNLGWGEVSEIGKMHENKPRNKYGQSWILLLWRQAVD